MRFLKNLAYLYLIAGLCFGVARFGWGAVVAAMAEPEDKAFTAGVFAAAVDGGIRVVDWAPTLVRDVVLEGGDIFDWLLYAR